MNAALWLRVSDPDVQTVENQRPALERLAYNRAWQVTRVCEWRVRHFAFYPVGEVWATLTP